MRLGFGPKVGCLSYLSCSDVAGLTGDSPATFSSPPAKLGTAVSRNLGIHFTVCLHGFNLGYALYIAMYLVSCFASFMSPFAGDEVGCLQ